MIALFNFIPLEMGT